MAEEENKTEDDTVDLSDAFDNVAEELQEEKPPQQEQVQEFFPDTPKIVQWTVRHSGGLIKDERQATYALFGVVGLLVIVSIVLFSSTGPGTKEIEAPPGQEIIYPENEPPRLR